MEPHSKFARLKDIRLHDLECPGQGRPAVLVHGSGLRASTWAPIADALATRFRALAVGDGCASARRVPDALPPRFIPSMLTEFSREVAR